MISIVSDNSYKLIRPELYPTTTDSPNESIASAEVGSPFDVLKSENLILTIPVFTIMEPTFFVDLRRF